MDLRSLDMDLPTGVVLERLSAPMWNICEPRPWRGAVVVGAGLDYIVTYFHPLCSEVRWNIVTQILTGENSQYAPQLLLEDSLLLCPLFFLPGNSPISAFPVFSPGIIPDRSESICAQQIPVQKCQ